MSKYSKLIGWTAFLLGTITIFALKDKNMQRHGPTRLRIKSEAHLPKEKIPLNSPVIERGKSTHAQKIIEEEDVPWEELTEQWNHRLLEYLTAENANSANQIYETYLEEKKEYGKSIGKLVDERESTLLVDVVTDEYKILDKKKYDELNDKIKRLARNHHMKCRSILGIHLQPLKTLYEDFEASIQAYGKEVYRISVDSTFDDEAY